MGSHRKHATSDARRRRDDDQARMDRLHIPDPYLAAAAEALARAWERARGPHDHDEGAA